MSDDNYFRAGDVSRDEQTGEHPGAKAMMDAVRGAVDAGFAGQGHAWRDADGEWHAKIISSRGKTGRYPQ